MPDKIPCTVYIDESGDLGTNGKGTQWFVLSAVIIDKDNESRIRSKIDQIRTRLNIHEIHLKDIKEYNKRAFIVNELSEENFIYTNVLVDTRKFDTARIPNSIIAYNYACKYLLQRVSWILGSSNRVGDIMLSARGTSRDNELIDYITNKLLPYPNNSIEQGVFNKISAKTAATWDLLQLADVCATTMFLTYEINGYGFCTPCFSMKLNDHLYRKNGKVDTYDIKFFTNDMKPDIEDLRKHRVCAKKERTPGATTT